jgi:hypothetical protein
MGEQKRRRYFAQNGVTRTLVTDEDEPDSFGIHIQQDVEAILASIKRDQEIMRHGTNKLAARLPLFVYEDLVARGITKDEDAFKKWLNGPEAAPWRIWKGDL